MTRDPSADYRHRHSEPVPVTIRGAHASNEYDSSGGF